ncbi:hypothetical protein UMM65_02360 [Aureibaculum sp. 2210JD6-5]|uniref:hypothetical protein n=1 Tax=Aureibaculum sp. 2210JD6-5 TaxID=3103957 RepID=UPI002AAC77AA|nr:hypothetical protein [Aureibaculum sp. 2210JD6-5]MDY7394069.1 hypothetical protein [Aureibaculum sp. 2210JD6-5]
MISIIKTIIIIVLLFITSIVNAQDTSSVKKTSLELTVVKDGKTTQKTYSSFEEVVADKEMKALGVHKILKFEDNQIMFLNSKSPTTLITVGSGNPSTVTSEMTVKSADGKNDIHIKIKLN